MRFFSVNPTSPSGGVPSPSLSLPRLCVSAVSGGGGKTLLSLGLARCWREAGRRVQPFKKGPDYIDAAWLTQAAGRAACNLDPFFLDGARLRLLLATAAGYGNAADEAPNEANRADVALIEGNRGLFDGLDVNGSCSTAELARRLACPVILSLNCTKMTRTAAAVVAGLTHFEPGVRVAGVVLGQTASSRHESIVRQAIERHTDVPVLGCLPRQRRNPLPERHMGLATPDGDAFRAETDALLAGLAALVREHVDVDAVLAVARSAPALDMALPPDCAGPEDALYGPAVMPERAPAARPVIGYVHDAAFWFYYPENLEALRRAGARLLAVSLLDDAPWPELDGLYLGGGFPEDFAAQLAASPRVRELAELAADGLPVYAECGGFMVLAEAIERDGRRHAMSGVFPVTARFCPRPQGLGYVEADVCADNPYFPAGIRLRGHEFHYSRCEAAGGATPSCALRLTKGTGMGGGRDGLVRGRVWAAYTHIFAPAVPQWAVRFAALAGRHAAEKAGGRTGA